MDPGAAGLRLRARGLSGGQRLECSPAAGSSTRSTACDDPGFFLGEVELGSRFGDFVVDKSSSVFLKGRTLTAWRRSVNWRVKSRTRSGADFPLYVQRFQSSADQRQARLKTADLRRLGSSRRSSRLGGRLARRRPPLVPSGKGLRAAVLPPPASAPRASRQAPL